MPVTNDNVFGDQIDGTRRAVLGGFPFRIAQVRAIQQPISPHEHFAVALPNDMPMQIIDGFGKEPGGVASVAARTIRRSNQEDFVHSDVKSISSEAID